MITTRLCPQCHQPLAPDAPAGLCPQCLMKAASGPPPSAAGDGLSTDIIDIADPAEVAKKLPQFEILEMLGRGGMGVVYKARQVNLDRVVALKILPPLDAQSPDFVARFTREARALAKLNHPNIVNVYDFGETNGLYYIIMEFVDGANLRQLLEARKLTPAEALAIVPKICDALQYAHEEGLVHRDIKPENLLIDKKGRVKIADFGLAKLLRREPLDMTLTLSGMALGTLRYMAPEQMDKPETVDHRADLYSLGVVIYEMLTGETPVGRFELPSQKAQVDVRFDEIVLHALEREPARRYQHASEVKTDMENVTSKPGAKAAPATPGARIGRSKGQTFRNQYLPRNGKDWVVGLLIVTPIIGGVFMMLPGGLAYFIMSSLGAKAGVALGGAVITGLFVFLGLFTLLGTGSVKSVRVSHDGLTIYRNIGPSKFLPWSVIRGIEPMSPGEVVREVMIWPGLPPRGTICCCSAHGFHRINCEGDCWYFNPRNTPVFLDAIERYQRPETAEATDKETPETTAREDAQRTLFAPAFVLMLIAIMYMAIGIALAVIFYRHGWLHDRSPSPLGGNNALWSMALFAAGVLMFEGARRTVCLTNYRFALASAIVASLPIWQLFGLRALPILGYIFPLIGLWAFVVLLIPRIRAAFAAPANEIKPGAENAAGEPKAAPLSPAEEAVRRARASWFGRRSEHFRTLLPPMLIFLQLVFIFASFGPWESPWLEMKGAFIPHKHGVVDSTNSFAFHPFTFSFLLLLIGFTLPFIAKRFSQIDNLVRYGCLLRGLRKDIQRRAKRKIFGCQAIAIFAPLLIAVLFEMLTSGGVLRSAGVTYPEYCLGPNSKAYEQLLIDLPFYTISENGVEHCRRPNQWDMAIGLKTKDSAEPVRMDIEMPSLRASYQPSWSKDYEVPIVLDLDELTKWMSDRGKLDVKDEKVKKEAAELMALLKRFSRQAPAEMHEFLAAREEMMPDFWMVGSQGWPGRNGSLSSMNGDWLMVVYLGSAVIFLALYFVVAIRIQRAAFALDREVRERGESVLAEVPLPRVKFGALPRDIRARTIRRAALAAVGLLLLPALAALMESAQPKRVKQTYHYALVPQDKYEKVEFGNVANKPSPLLKHFQEVVISVPFESYERDGEHWFVQPHPAKLEVTFCRPKNFSGKPGEVKWVEQPGNKGVHEGENFSFTVELPSLREVSSVFSAVVTLDEEELLKWMQYTIASTTEKPAGSNWRGWGVTKSDGTQVQLYSLSMDQMPELKALAAELMAFLKKYATSAPTTHEAFLAALQQAAPMIPPTGLKTASLRMDGWHIFPTEELTHESLATGFAIAAALLILLALLPLLKRSAVRAAMRQGTPGIEPQNHAVKGETPIPS